MPDKQGKFVWRDAFSLRVTGLLILVILVLLATAATALLLKQNEQRDLKLAQGRVLQEELDNLKEES